MKNSIQSTPAVGQYAAADAWVAAMPLVFVLLWSTGFIGLKFGAPHAEPFTFMAIRMGIVVSLLGVAALAMRAPWPQGWRAVGHLAIAGLLVHATYLCGVLTAIERGLPLDLVALIAGLQPILTALFASRWLGERLTGRQWTGMGLGLVGVVCVVLARTAWRSVDWSAISGAAIGLAGITTGTLYQKRYCSTMDIRTGGVVQFSATGIVLTALAFAFETRTVHWTGEFIFALAWLSLVLSIGAITLLYLMIRRGAASEVASLFFLTPSVTALMAWALFGERLAALAIAGLVLSALGVALVGRR